jgi:ArsR family transcriptional regulator
MAPVTFLKYLSDPVRLNATLLIRKVGELCVCELMEALGESQPKVSRHLAQLRNCQLLEDIRRGQWVYYRLDAELPQWALNILDEINDSHAGQLEELMKKLNAMKNRPVCC